MAAKPILFALAAVLILVNPLDCFSQLANERPASCCASRHCNPAAQNRACCQVELFQYSQYFQAAKKAPMPAPDFSAVPVNFTPQFESAANISWALVDFDVHAPPGEPASHNLPLLI